MFQLSLRNYSLCLAVNPNPDEERKGERNRYLTSVEKTRLANEVLGFEEDFDGERGRDR